MDKREFSQYSNSSLLIFDQIKAKAVVLKCFLRNQMRECKNHGNSRKSSAERNGVVL